MKPVQVTKNPPSCSVTTEGSPSLKLVIWLTTNSPVAGVPLALNLRATMPVKVTVPAGRVYQYYDPDKQGRSVPASLTVVQKP